MKRNVFSILGIFIILVSVFFIGAQNYDYIKPIILSIGNSSNNVAVPMGILFLGLFLSLIGISPSKKVGSYE